MINEGARCLEDKIVDKASAIDIGMIFGTGFPPFLGGLLKYADTIGIPQVVARLEELSQKFGSARFAPCRYLMGLKEKNKSFYSI